MRKDDNAQAAPLASGDELLRIGEVARRLKICTKHVRNLVAAGRLPAPLRLGRATRWRKSDVDAFIAAGGKMEGER